MLCIGYKWLDDPVVHVPAISDWRGWKRNILDDSRLLKHFYRVLSEAEMWVTYFGKGFDVKYLQAKFLEHEIGYLPNTPHVDLFYTVKSNLALSRKSLANVADYLSFEAEKTPVTGKLWKRAMVGDPEALQYVINHCRSDVLLLEEAYLKLRPLVRTHHRVNGYGPCRACGQHKLQQRGVAITTNKQRKHRYQCQACGTWESRPMGETVLVSA